jgi:hypothetical protein
MASGIYGLFSLICEPDRGKFLDQTSRSSDPKSAKKRGSETAKHMMIWYESELKPNSK